MADKSIKQLMNDWKWNAKLFVKEALKVKRITKQQAKGLDELTKLVNAKIKAAKFPDDLTEEEIEYSKKKGISIMSGQGTGKDAFAAWAILWLISLFPFPKIPCTAPTAHQLKDILWSEISKWMRNGDYVDDKGNKQPGFLNQILKWQAESLFMKAHKGKEWFAVARTANPKASADEQEETLSGFHADYLMYVVDEASGVKNPVFKPIEGTLTGICNIALIIFNPTRNSGFALETQKKYRKDWICLNWNAEKSEIVTRDHIEYMRNKYGTDSNVYRIRVLGQPPKSEEDALIPWEWIMDAVDREVEIFDDDPVKVGCDVGGGGDPSVTCKRTGPHLDEMRKNNEEDTTKVTHWIASYVHSEYPDAVMTDIIGLGRGVYDQLVQMGYRVYGVNVAKTPFNREKFVRLRDELFWRVREAFEKCFISIPDDEELIGELSVIKYGHDINGKIKVEGKKELKKRGIASPNKADALALTYYLEDSILSKKERDPYDEEDDFMPDEDAYMYA